MTRLTRFEVARIVGARSLQISMGAPLLVSSLKTRLDPMEIAFAEYQKGIIPITVRRGLDS
ncbi:MAG: DNA-directed RNA polymerase subunit K [Methanomassiliicoccales archaeon]|nr:MAG: DNA-directed RNA polymerase subunit K [Methanomassiliicoccales archaeon]